MAALYDPRYDYPSTSEQRAIGTKGVSLRNLLLRKLYPDTVASLTLDQRRDDIIRRAYPAPPPAQAAPALQTGAYAPEMPVADVERPLTEAQKHARKTGTAEAMYYDANDNLVPANTDSINAYQGDIVSNNTAALPTRGETLDNRRSGIMMNQDPARYLPDGSSLDDGMGNTYRLDGDDKDAVFQSLVKRYLDEGLGMDAAIAKADERMAMGPLESLQENLSNAGTGALEFIGGIRDGGILSAGKDEDGAVARLVKQAEDRRDKHFLDAGNGNAARRMTGGYTGNARGSGLPDMQIGLNERLMRMGAAGLAAGGQGSLAQMGAMFGASADVNQANRQGAMDTFKIEEERRQAHADRVAKLAAAKNKGMGAVKDFEAKNFGFYNRGVDAERVLGKLEEQGTDFWKTVGSKVPLFGNKFVGAEYRQYDQARRNFVNAVLRRESGAVISDAEFENANIQYFPVFGDEEAEIAQKRENRRTTMLGIRSGTGSAMQFTSSYPSSGTVQVGGATITPIAD